MTPYIALGAFIVLIIIVVVLIAGPGRSEPKPKGKTSESSSRGSSKKKKSKSTSRSSSSSKSRRDTREQRRREREERKSKRKKRSTKPRGTRSKKSTGGVVEAILVDENGERYAMVGDRQLKQGDSYSGRRIISIGMGELTVEHRGKTYSVRIGQPITP
jgi:hypothetical protein